MNIDVTKHDGQIIAKVSGEVDADNCTELSLALPADASQLPLVLDLADLTFIDSSGISELIRLQDSMTASGRQFAIDQASPAVLRVLSITGLLSVFGLEG